MTYLWDIYIFYPILFVIMCAGAFFIFFKEYKHKLQWFFLGYIFFWLFGVAISFVSSFGLNLNSYHWIDPNGNHPALLFGVSSLFYAAIFSVVLNWASDWFNNRKIIIQISMVVSIAGSILVMASHNLWSAVLSSVFLGCALGTLPLLILSFNETIKHRIRPFGALRSIFMIMMFAVFAAIAYAATCHVVINHADAWTVSDNNTQVYGLVEIGSIVMTVVGFVLSFFAKDSKERAGKFNDFELKTFAPYNWKSVLVLFALLLVLIADFTLSQGPLASLLISQHAYDQQVGLRRIGQYRRLFQMIFLLGAFVSAIGSGWLVLKHMEMKYSLGICLIAWFAYFVFAAFNHSPVAFLVMQLLNGLAAGILIQTILSIILGWNYRNRHLPIFGFAFGTVFFVLFLNYFITNICALTKVGIYEKYNSLLPYIGQPGYGKIVDDITTIIFTTCAVTMLIIMMTTYYISDFLFAEYVSPNTDLAAKLDKIIKANFINTDNILNVHDAKMHSAKANPLLHKKEKSDEVQQE